MNKVHGAVPIGAVDLNLLRALDALLAERNVTRAAERVGLTQSAMSHALARLRRLLGDELLVRTPRGMVPTPRADALGPPIASALAAITQALTPAAFDPKSATGEVVIATSDYVEHVLLRALVATLAREAPGIDLRLVPMEEDMPGAIAAGSVHLLIAPPRVYPDRGGILVRHLFDDGYVCVVRKGHPLARKRLTLARFVDATHLLIAPRGRPGGTVDDALGRLGLTRRVAVAVPHFLIAPPLVQKSDLVLTLAARVAQEVAKTLGLVTLTPPPELALGTFSMAMFWHERTRADPLQRWMRDLVVRVVSGL